MDGLRCLILCGGGMSRRWAQGGGGMGHMKGGMGFVWRAGSYEGEFP